MIVIPPHTLVDEGTHLLWTQFADIVRQSQWTSHDNLMLSLLPTLASTRCVFAQKNEDGSFLGAVVWAENDDGIAWIGMYMCVPELRGHGVGSNMWQRAMNRIRATGKVIGLRGVAAMAPKYEAHDTPFELSRLRKHIVSCTDMREICDKLHPSTTISSALLKLNLSAAQLKELLEFDQQMTLKDRSALLLPFLSSSSFECAVLLDENGKISAWAGITAVGLEQESRFKLAPVYAPSLTQFAALTQALLPFCERVSSGASIVVHILTGTVGALEVEPLLKNKSQSVELVTLFSEPIDWKLRTDMCYSPHSVSYFFDG